MSNIGIVFKMLSLYEQHWYRSSLTFLTYCLLPFSWLFRLCISIRRFLYHSKIKKSFAFPVPIIVVGNITVGGTGKTPFVIWLVQQLSEQGYTPGIVTRGVGGKRCMKPSWIDASSDVKEVGDEAVLLAKRAQCPIVTCVDRVAAVQELLSKTKCTIVISDDGLQHYRLKRDIEIAIIDDMRGFGNQQLLPAGPLREPVSRLKKVDLIIKHVMKWDYTANVSIESLLNQLLASEKKKREFEKISNEKVKECRMLLQGDIVISIKNESHKIPLATWNHRRIHAVAAIGNPKRFFSMLREKGFDVVEHGFSDHYFFREQDLNFSDDLPIVMTEKDAVKCREFTSDKLWYIPVNARLI
jgi:tetraacyldisaccharide 4'-kinase